MTACSKQQDPLRLGTNIWPGYEPLYLAQEHGLLDDNRVRLIGYPSASEVIRAFRNHSLDAASLTLDEALLLLDHGLPLKVILVHDVSHGADVILARDGIEKVTDLRGHTIAVESSALGAYVITRALQNNNIGLDEVKIRHLDVNQHELAYQAGDIDAAVTFEPYSREIPGEIVDVLVVHEDVHKNRLQDLKHLTQSWFSALEYLELEPEKAATIMGKRLKVSNDEVLASYQGLKLPTREQNITMLDGEQLGLRKLAAIMKQHQLLSRDPKFDLLLSSDALR